MPAGRKPSNPKVKDLESGKLGSLRVVGSEGAGGGGAGDDSKPAKAPAKASPPPSWMKNADARKMWRAVLPQLIARKQYLRLFEAELARYCQAYGQYVEATKQLTESETGPVTLSSKGVPMLSMWFIAQKAAGETMRQLAGDLGFNPVAQLRMQGLQLDLFDDPGARPNGPPSTDNPFAQFRSA